MCDYQSYKNLKLFQQMLHEASDIPVICTFLEDYNYTYKKQQKFLQQLMEWTYFFQKRKLL
jgi:hypothetical protein